MKRLLPIFLLPALMLLVGCGGLNEKKLEAASARVEALADKGLPDSLVSPGRVKLYDAVESRKRHRDGQAKESYKAAIEALDIAEAALANSVTERKPQVESKYASYVEEIKGNLRGLHLKEADSLLAEIDSLIKINYIFKADNKLNALDDTFKSLKEQQKLADSLHKKVIGSWKFIQQYSHNEDKSVNAIEKKTWNFYKNGNASFVEEKKGKSSPFLKEDWKFVSKGTWDMKGDTVHILTTRFASVRQNFFAGHQDGGKIKWKKETQPTYDSTITDGSQNRFITINDLKEDYKHNK